MSNVLICPDSELSGHVMYKGAYQRALYDYCIESGIFEKGKGTVDLVGDSKSASGCPYIIWFDRQDVQAVKNAPEVFISVAKILASYDARTTSLQLFIDTMKAEQVVEKEKVKQRQASKKIATAKKNKKMRDSAKKRVDNLI